jgi:hypothetical protein
MKAIAYIDGFNLYYQAVKGIAYKWLDIPRACQMLVPEHSVALVKYFTAPVGGKTDTDKPRRQQQYWRALKEIGCEIIQGKFMSRSAFMPLDGGSGKLVPVIPGAPRSDTMSGDPAAVAPSRQSPLTAMFSKSNLAELKKSTKSAA